MSTKRKQKQEDDNESKNMFDSFKKIFRGNTKINKLNRVVSHKPNATPRNNNSLRRRPRSQSEPDLLSESLVLDSTDVKLETFVTKPKLLLINESPMKSRSFDNFNQQLAETCPSKAAKRLGLDQDEPVYKMKPKEKKEQSGGNTLKTRKSETGLRGSKRFSVKSKEKEPKENRALEMEAVAMPANVSSKAAKTLGIQAVDVPCKAAKTLGISSQYDQADKLTTEDFLRKIGAFASEKGKPVQRSLHKQATSPVLMSHRTKSEQKSATDISTNALLRKLVQLSPTDQSRNTAPKPSMKKMQSEASLAVSRKRRMETRSEETVATSTHSRLSLCAEDEIGKRCNEKTSEKRTLPRPNSVIVPSSKPSDCVPSKSLLITDHRTTKPAFESNKDIKSNHTLSDHVEPTSAQRTDAHDAPRQLPTLKTLQLNQKKLLKKCESDSRIAIPGK